MYLAVAAPIQESTSTATSRPTDATNCNIEPPTALASGSGPISELESPAPTPGTSTKSQFQVRGCGRKRKLDAKEIMDYLNDAEGRMIEMEDKRLKFEAEREEKRLLMEMEREGRQIAQEQQFFASQMTNLMTFQQEMMRMMLSSSSSTTSTYCNVPANDSYANPGQSYVSCFNTGQDADIPTRVFQATRHEMQPRIADTASATSIRPITSIDEETISVISQANDVVFDCM